jgi:hypothetical protein
MMLAYLTMHRILQFDKMACFKHISIMSMLIHLNLFLFYYSTATKLWYNDWTGDENIILVQECRRQWDREY